MRIKLLTELMQAAILCAVSAACAFAQDSPPAQINPIKWSLKADLAGKPLKAGDKLAVQLAAEIEDGWHLYSTEEMPQGPKPTRITLAPNQPFELIDIESPEPRREFDQNFGIETEFYEHSVTFMLTVQVKAEARAGTHKLIVQVRYQGCTETLCLPPRLVKLEVEVLIKDHVSIRTMVNWRSMRWRAARGRGSGVSKLLNIVHYPLITIYGPLTVEN